LFIYSLQENYMRARESQENIYDTALSVFADFGYQKSTMDDIAGRLSMTKGNLYRYASCKRELYEKTVAHCLLKWQSKVGEAIAGETDPRHRFLVMCFKAVEYLAGDDPFRRLLAHDPDIFPMFAENDPYGEINKNSVGIIRDILKQGMAEGVFREIDPDRISNIVFMIYKMFIIRTYIQSKDEFIRDMFADTVELLMHGLFIDADIDLSDYIQP
jgi:AcrR family transcriptional regulator